jgi:spore germination cell wall hydrolase CwlJ-like protein
MSSTFVAAIAALLITLTSSLALAEEPEPSAAPSDTPEERWVITPRQRLLARVVFAEACDEPLEGKIAVAAVVLNRLVHPKYPHELEDVIYQPGAFTSFCADSPLWQLGAREHLMNPAQKRAWAESLEAAKRAMLGEGDPTIIAFRATRLTSTDTYFARLIEVTTIGRHRFYTQPLVLTAE